MGFVVRWMASRCELSKVGCDHYRSHPAVKHDATARKGKWPCFSHRAVGNRVRATCAFRWGIL